MEKSKLDPLKEFQRHLLNGVVMAERRECARIAAAQDNDKAWTVGKRISRLILDRPMPTFELPPTMIGMQDIVRAVIVMKQKGSKRK